MPQTLSKEQILEIPELVKTMTIKEIAAHFGVHERTINQRIKDLRRQGVAVQTRLGRPAMKLT